LPDDSRDLYRYRSEVEKERAKVDQAFSVIVSSLSSTILITVESIMVSAVSDKVKCRQILASLKRTEGGNSEATKSVMFKDIEKLPFATDASTAIQLMAGLAHINAMLTKMGAPMTNAQLRTKLFERLSAQMFHSIAERINMDPTMTFEVACEQIRSSCDLHSMLSGHKRSADAAGQMQINSQMVTSDSRPPVRRRLEDDRSEDRERMQRLAYGYGDEGERESYVAALNTFNGPSCWNCLGGHMARDCPAQFCKFCSTSFTSYEDPNYHRFVDCPRKMDPRTSGVSGRGRGRGRARISESPRGRGIPDITERRYNRPTFRGRGSGRESTRSIAAVHEVRDDDYSGDRRWDEYIASSEVGYQDEDEYDCGGGKSDSNVNSLGVINATRANGNGMMARRLLMDSGASIHAVPPVLAMDLGLQVYKWKHPKKVRFGNGAVVVSVFYVYGGTVLRQLAIVEGLSTSILSISLLNSRGYTVLFGGDMMCCVYNRDKDLVFKVPMTWSEMLYYVDIKCVLEKSYWVEAECRVNAMTARMSRTTIQEVMRLHDNLSHAASSVVMSAAIRSGAWPGVTVSPIYPTLQCYGLDMSSR
jgi:hypothetical protein